ncbi:MULTISPECIES: hypothetical protein [unclassified Pseudomonas]|uniref:hypothetical protein n=1 Tax=unclassified Pseudomonas TaxID=196821 RepID=UPI001C609EB5|nr:MULTISPECIES: hypothetical protein [unclassified Pseudomonas]MBW5416097.1 hypothetical protein [Pseudomonas sp. MAG002Y]
MITELIAQCWPVLLALMTAIGGIVWGHQRATRKAKAEIAVAKTEAAVSDQRAEQAEQKVKEVELINECIQANQKKRAQTNADIVAMPLRDKRSELQRDWTRKE